MNSTYHENTKSEQFGITGRRKRGAPTIHVTKAEQIEDKLRRAGLKVQVVKVEGDTVQVHCDYSDFLLSKKELVSLGLKVERVI